MNHNLNKLVSLFTILSLILVVATSMASKQASADYCAGQLKCTSCDLGTRTCYGGSHLDQCGGSQSSCGGERNCGCGGQDCTISNTCYWKVTSTPTPPPYYPPPPPPPAGTPWPTPPPGNVPEPPPGNPPPPPGQPETCYRCQGYQCRAYQVDPGQCFTNCGDDDCGDKPDDTPPPTEICARCENFQCVYDEVPEGTCTTSCNPNACKPPFNYIKSCTVSVSNQTIPTTSQIDINVSGTSNAPATEVEPTRLIMAKSDYSKMTIVPSGAIEHFNSDNNRYFYVFQTDPVLLNGSFENGKNYWYRSPAIRGDWTVVSNLVWPVPGVPSTNGNYYLSAHRQWVDDHAGADAHIASNWILTSDDLSGQRFKLSFKAKSHSTTKVIKGIALQRYPKVVGNTLDWSNTLASFNDITIHPGGWSEFSRDVTFPPPGNANNSTLMRVILRVSSYGDGYEPVYYDHVRLVRATNNTFNCNTSSSTTCQDLVTLKGIDHTGGDGELPEGNYIAFCDMPTNPPPPDERLFMCTGNPNCLFNGGTASTDASCSTWWKNCGPNDHTTFSIINNCSAPFCGQGGCPATDVGTPAPITSIWAEPLGGTGGITHALSASPPLTNNVKMRSTTDRAIRIIWDTPTTDTKTDVYELYIWNRLWKSTLTEVINTTGLPGWGVCNSGQNVCRYRINRETWAHHARNHTVISNSTHSPHLLRVAVRAINEDCYATTQIERNVDLVSDLSSNFYESDLGSCNGTTQAVPELINSFEARSTVAGNTYTQTKNLPITSSNFTFENIPYIPTSAFGDIIISATLNPTPSDPANTYVCSSCNIGGADNVCVLNNLNSPGTIRNIYLDKYNLSNGPWWQVSNGLVYAGESLESQVPDTCGTSEGTCKRAISARELGASINIRSAGPPMTGSSSIESGSGKKSDRSAPDPTDAWSRGVNFSSLNNNREDYSYFASKVNFNGNVNLLSSSATTNLDTSMIYDNSDNTRVLYRNGNLTINPPTPGGISIPAGRKIVVFVNGNLTINDHGGTNRRLFNVPQSSYLAFIVSGNITFSRNIGYDITETNYTSYAFEPNVSGVFVANRIIIDSDNNSTTPEKKFVGEGTFVAWGSGQAFEFKRDFNDGYLGKRFHNAGPTELFRYRPAYLELTPNIMQSPGLLWQEVN